MTKQTVNNWSRYKDERFTGLDDCGENVCAWHVIWTKSNFERLVRDQLLAKGYEVFLPMIDQWSIRPLGSEHQGERPSKHSLEVPMFKGYLFVHQKMDRHAYLDVSNTKGVAQLLGTRWNNLGVIPEDEIAAIMLLANNHAPLMPYPYLKLGEKVKIIRGPMTNAHGTLVKQDAEKGVFVVSVNMLKQSIAMDVDIADVMPI